MSNSLSRNRQLVLAIFLIIALASVKAEAAWAQSAITFMDDFTENAFPLSLTFNITADSNTGDISSATLFYRYRNSTNWTRQIVEVDPGSEVTLSYAWDTGDVTTVPSSPIYYYWEVSDTAGNRQRSEETLVHYDDIRYEWRVLEDENIAVWWHDRPEAFGQRVYDIAQRAFTEQQALFGVAPDHQIRIIIYNDFDEFAGWHSYLDEFVGGQAFSSLGITTQVVNAYASEEIWLNDVIPHEISHLYLYQASYNPLTSVPAWLNEGLAQYNEFSFDQRGVLRSTQERILAGELLPLWSLSGSFGYDEDQFRFAYGEAYSAVTYMVDTYGEEGLISLLAAYREGLNLDEAFVAAFGRNLDEFELDWLAWQGVPLEMYPTRTPKPDLVWPTAPPMAVTPTRRATDTPEPSATATIGPTEPSAVAVTSPEPPTVPPQPTAAPVTAGPVTAESEVESGGLPCASGLLPLALLAMVILKPGGRRANRRGRTAIEGKEDRR